MSASPELDAHLLLRKNTLLSIVLTCVAYAYYNITDAVVKVIGHKFHFSEIMAVTCTVTILSMLGAAWWRGGKGTFRIVKTRWVLIRAAFSVVTSVLNIFAIPHVKLTTFYTLIFTSPLMVALLASLFLGEKLEKKRLAVILTGFAAVVYVFRPGSGLFNIWSLLVVLSAAAYSCGLVIMRHLGPKESRIAIITMGSAAGLLFSLPFLPFHYVAPTPYEWLLLVMMGGLGSIGVFCILYAFQNAPSAALVAPFHYTQIVWGALLGYYLFHEVPEPRVVTGAAVIIMSGLYVILSEARRPRLPASRSPV